MPERTRAFATGADQDRFVRLQSGTRLCYRVEGEDSAPAVLLVAGLAEDLTTWSPAFVSGLVGQGMRVIRMDNRDCGRSSYVPTPPPNLLRQLAGRPRADAYTLRDMAADCVGLLEHLGTGPVHVVGRSMGGMIAQTLAASWPALVRTLTSLYSTTGAKAVGRPALSSLALLSAPPPRTRDRAVRAHLRITRHLAGARFPMDAAAEAATAGITWDRSDGDQAAGSARQIQAIQASGDRARELGAITAPTLVIHGDRDLLVATSGGRATAAAVEGARFVLVPGMGHHLPDSLAQRLLPHVLDHMAVTGDPR